VGLAARVLERAGLPTVTLTSALDISERVRPPRSAFLDFPLGNQVGPPGDAGLQRRILLAALRLLETARTPGLIERLPFEWPDAGWRAAVRAQYRLESETVRRQRVEGEYLDGDYIGERECLEVCSLV
jgi:hypothetical protein